MPARLHPTPDSSPEPSPEPRGVTIPLDRPSDRWATWLLGIVLAAFVGMGLFFSTSPWAALPPALLCVLMGAILRKYNRPIGRRLTVSPDRVRLDGPQGMEWEVAASAVTRIERETKAFLSPWRLLANDRVIGEIPVQAIESSYSVEALLRVCLPHAKMTIDLGERETATRRGAIGSVLAFLSGTAILGFVWHLVTSPATMRLPAGLSLAFLLSAFTLVAVGISWGLKWLSLKRQERHPPKPHVVDYEPPMAERLYPYLQLHRAGYSIPGMSFAYPETIRTLDMRRQSINSWSATGGVAGLLFLPIVVLWASLASARPLSLALLATALSGVCLAVVLGTVHLSRRYLRQLRTLHANADSRLVLQGDHLYIEREGRLLAAQWTGEPRLSFAHRSEAGLGGGMVTVEAEGQTYTYDPTAMKPVTPENQLRNQAANESTNAQSQRS